MIDIGLNGHPPCFVPMLDEDGYLYVGGVKVARHIRERGTLQFVDKDSRRAARRGCSFVEVRLERLFDLAD